MRRKRYKRSLVSKAEERKRRKKRKPFQFSFGEWFVQAFDVNGLWRALHERFKRFAQHSRVLLPVVAEPSFPQRKSPNAIVGYGRLTVRDDVLDVLTRPYRALQIFLGWFLAMIGLAAATGLIRKS